MIEITKNIFFVGIQDWDLRKFHGHELSTHRGSSYNSYIIRDKKTVLVDTVWDPYKEEFVSNLEKNIGLQNIDYIIIQHCEIDHSGSLGLLMEKIPNVPIYCTKHGADNIRKHFHKEYNFNIVKTGDVLDIGENKLVFVEMQMIHWPDSLLTYVQGANVVLSNDAFGQHYTTSGLFNDEVDECELYQEAVKYYANIVTPYSSLVKKKIEEIKSLNLTIDMIAPSHGVIWRKNPMQIVEKYYEWSNNYSEDFVLILYDTMYNATKTMAECIGEGLASKGIKYKLYNTAVSDKSDVMTDIFRSKALIVGSCTVNNVMLSSIAAILEELKGLKMKNKYAASFGSYGWSGEAHKRINIKLEEAGFKIVENPISLKYRPTEEEKTLCFDYGVKFADKIL